MVRLAVIALALAGPMTSQPDSAEEWRRIGLDRISAGQLQAATLSLEKACELERAPGDSCYYLGRNLNALGDFEAARKAFDLAFQKAPAELAARVHRAAGLNYVALGRDEEAERHLRKAIAPGHNSKGDDARIDLGSFLFRQGRLDEALKVLESANKAKPDSARANLELGRVLLQAGRLEAAVMHLQKAITLSPQNWNAHLLLGRAYQRLGRAADAERELRLGENQWKQKQR